MVTLGEKLTIEEKGWKEWDKKSNHYLWTVKMIQITSEMQVVTEEYNCISTAAVSEVHQAKINFTMPDSDFNWRLFSNIRNMYFKSSHDKNYAFFTVIVMISTEHPEQSVLVEH